MKTTLQFFLGITLLLFVASCSKDDDSNKTSNGSNTTSSKRILFDGNVETSLGISSKNIETNNGIYCVKNDLNTKNIEVSFIDLEGKKLKQITLSGQTDLHDINKDEQGNLVICGTIYSSSNVVTGRVFTVKMNQNLEVLWQKKYDKYSLPYYDSYYYNAISNISNSRLVICNLGNLLIIDASNGNLIKTLQFSSLHWLRTLALTDGFMSFGRVGVDFYISKFDWNGNLIFMKYAQDTRPDALLTCSNPIKTISDKIIIPYNTYQYNTEGRGGNLVLDMQGNLINHWNNQFTIDTPSQVWTNRGGLPIEQIAQNVFLVRTGTMSYYVNENGDVLGNHFYQGYVFKISEENYLIFNGSQSAYYNSYEGPMIFNKNKDCFTLNVSRMRNVSKNVNLLPYNFVSVSNTTPSVTNVNYESINISSNLVSIKTISFEDSDFCNRRAIE